MHGIWQGKAPLVLASTKRSRGKRFSQRPAFLSKRSPAAIDERAVEAPLLDQGASGAEIAAHLARAKAQAVASHRPGRLVLGADQSPDL